MVWSLPKYTEVKYDQPKPALRQNLLTLMGCRGRADTYNTIIIKPAKNYIEWNNEEANVPPEP